MVQLIRREIKTSTEEKYEIDTLGVNSNNIFSIICKDGKIINFRADEAVKIKEFLNSKMITVDDGFKIIESIKKKIVQDKDQIPRPIKIKDTVTETDETVYHYYV